MSSEYSPANYIVIERVRFTDVSFRRELRLLDPVKFLLNRASLSVDRSIIIKPANLLLENKHDTTSDC